MQGTWLLESITVYGRPVVIPLESPRWSGPPIFRFWSDGRVTGHLPCNAVSGSYEFDGHILTWDMRSEAIACLEPEGVMQAEEQLHSLLWSDTVSVEFDEQDSALATLFAGDYVVATFRRAPAG
ncbi:MAG: META domain-containing protein [Actinobacteria bacterium]|nr:META domain-containing protein [Actinomycetota bacterium]